MKIIVIGATGTVGKPIVAALQVRHEVIKVGSKSGDYQVDIKDSGSIRKLFEKTGRFDALVSCVGKVHFGEFAKLTETEVMIGLKDKLMGKVTGDSDKADYDDGAKGIVKTSDGKSVDIGQLGAMKKSVTKKACSAVLDHAKSLL